MARSYLVSSIPGDGIGPEVVAVSKTVIDAVAQQEGFKITWETHPWGSAFYDKYGQMMPPSGIAELARTDAIFFGAVGAPHLSDALTLWGLLIPIRREFDQYINLRPAKYVPGLRSPLQHPEGIDLLIVRENSEGEYSEVGGRFARGTTREFATQESIFTRVGIARIADYAASLAAGRSKRVTNVTKSNGIIHTMPFWDEIVTETVSQNPDITLRHVLVDAMSAELVLKPQNHDVIVCSNLFGDIISDLASATLGSLGIAASANINPSRETPSMFESVHGSAPDIAGKGIANPFAQLSSGVMMLEHLGEGFAAARIQSAIHALIKRGDVTQDLGGALNTKEVEAKLLQELDA